MTLRQATVKSLYFTLACRSSLSLRSERNKADHYFSELFQRNGNVAVRLYPRSRMYRMTLRQITVKSLCFILALLFLTLAETRTKQTISSRFSEYLRLLLALDTMQILDCIRYLDGIGIF